MDEQELKIRDKPPGFGVRAVISERENRGRRRKGFAVAPILYVLGLVGVGAAVLFSGYSQILRTNVQVTNNLATKNDLNGNATTLAASAILSGDTKYLCPPTGGSPGTNCSSVSGSIPVMMTAISGQAQLPANASSAGSTGSPTEVGIFTAGSGVKQLDAYGHYYIYCRWENPTNPGSGAAFSIISAGPSGNLQTYCGNTTAQGDNLMVQWPVTTAINRSAVWQAVPNGSSTQVEFGQTGSKVVVDQNGDVTIPGWLNTSGLATVGSLSTTGSVSGGTGTFSGLVSAGSGSISGTLGVIGNTSLGVLTAGASTLNSVTVTNNTSIGGTLGVTGNTTLNILAAGSSTLNSLTVSNNASVGGTLGVTGATTLGGNTSVGGTLGVSGATTLGGLTAGTTAVSSLTVSGATTIGGTLGVTGAATFGSTVSITGNLSGSTATFSGTVTASSFNGTIGAGNINWGTTIVPVPNGGTGDSTLTGYLYGNGTSPVSTSTTIPASVLVGAGTLPPAVIATGEITSVMMAAPSSSTAGPYYSVMIDASGRVTSGTTGYPASSSLTDGAGESITLNSTTGITFGTGNASRMVLNTSGNLIFSAITGQTVPSLDLSQRTDALSLPSGTTAQRPSPGVNGMLRYNTSAGITNIEGYVNGTWASLVTSGGGQTISSGVVLGNSPTTTNPQRNGDATTGFFSPQASTVAVAAGGGEVERWTTTGVGIGTTGVANKLDVNGAVAIGSYAGTAGTPNGLIVSGKVGIGLSGPAYSLDVAGGDINLASGQYYRINGNNALWQDATNGNVAIGPTAFPTTVSQAGGAPNGQYNTAVGSQALNANTTGGANTAIGWDTLLVNSTGGENVVVGGLGLSYNTTGSNNASVGYKSLADNTTGSNNTVLGWKALPVNTTGSNNTVIGSQVAYTTLTTGSSNILIGTSSSTDTATSSTSNAIAIGGKAGQYDTAVGIGALAATSQDGNRNTAIGYQALYANTTGNQNTAVGLLALSSNTTGNVNIAIGGAITNIGVLQANTTGNYNTAIGSLALSSNTTGSYNIATGISALGSTSSGSYNTAYGANALAISTVSNNAAFGYNAGKTLTTGGSNLALGYNVASTTLATGSSNILIGTSNAVDTPAAATSNFLNIGNTIFATSTNTGTLAAPAGNVGIGVTTPANKLDVNGGMAIGAYAGTAGASNGLIVSGNVGIGSTSPGVSLDLSQRTDAVALPVGTVGTRPGSPANGMIRYSSSIPAIEAYVNGAWTSVLVAGNIGSGILLGTSASATNPQRTGDVTTGFFSDTVNTIEMAAAGTKVFSIANTGILNIPIAPSGGTYNGSLQLNGNNAVWQDASSNNNLAVGATNFPTTVSQAGGGTNGQANTAVGMGALNANTIGTRNTALGTNALVLNTTGTLNTALGAFALSSDTTGGANTAVGKQSMGANTTGGSNTAVGLYALPANTTGSNNTAVGMQTLYTSTASAANTALGYQAGYDVSTGQQNIIIGYYPTTGVGITSGSYNILIGQDLQKLTPTSSNQLDIGNLIFATGLSVGATMSTGNVGIGTSAPTSTLQVNGTVTATNFAGSMSGTITTSSLTLTGLTGYVYANNASPVTASTTIPTTALSGTLAAAQFPALTGDVTTTAGSLATTVAKIQGTTVSGTTGTGNVVFSASPTLTGTITAAAANFSGNVGIGTATPGNTLQIYGGANTTVDLAVNGRIQTGDSNGNGGVWVDSADTKFVGSSGSSGLGFYTVASSWALVVNTNGGTAMGSYANVNTPPASGLIISGSVGIGSTSPQVSLDISTKTDAIALPVGTTGNRPSGANGMLRYNSSLPGVESYVNGTWAPMAITGALVFGTSASSTSPQRSGDATTGEFSPAVGSVAVAISGTEMGRWTSTGLGIGSTTPVASLDLSKRTDAVALPVGTTGQEPGAPVNGMIRYNSTIPDLEAYIGGVWTTITTTTGADSLLTLGMSATATSPSRAGDLTTGFFSPAAATVATSISGTEMERWTSTGLGIGTSAPGYKLDVNGDLNVRSGQYYRHNGSIIAFSGGGGTSFYLGGATANAGIDNIVAGYQALNSGTTGGYNSAFGSQALYTNSSGSNNVAVGSLSLYSQTTGGNNTAVGYYAGDLITTGTNNLILGYDVASSTLTTGSSNILIGTSSSTTTATAATSNAIAIGGKAGTQEVGVGVGSLAATSADNNNNTAVGYFALHADTTGGGNVAVGNSSLKSNTTGGSNIAIGEEAVWANTTGNNNIGIGDYALQSTSSGFNIAVGTMVLWQNTTGTNNTAVGYWAGNALVSGSYNVLLGNGVGTNTLSSGSSNILIGTSSTTDTATASTSNAIAIGGKAGTYDTGVGIGALAATNTDSNFNVAVGYQALTANTSGSGNVAIGNNTLYDNTTGGHNTAIGYDSLYPNTTGANNTAVGSGAEITNTTGSWNTAFGVNALESNSTGSNNAAFGQGSLIGTTGSANTAVGQSAGASITTGTNNLALGYQVALGTLTTGSSNILIGTSSATTTATASTSNAIAIGGKAGQYDTSVGFQALAATSQNGNLNTAIGYSALTSDTTGQTNVAVGYVTAENITTGGNNTALGYEALGNNTTGSNNTVIGGHVGGTTLNGGTSNILIGGSSAVDTPLATTSNFLNIGNTIFATSTNTGTLAAPAGSVGINQTSPSYTLDVTGTGRFTGAITVASCTGCMGTLTLGTSASATSPQRSGDATTGLFSASTGTVSISASGTDVADYNSTGINLPAATEIYKINGTNMVSNTGTSNYFGNAGNATATGSQDNALGSLALSSLTSGGANTAIGQWAGKAITTGSYNTAVGNMVLSSAVGTTANTAFGASAGGNISSGNYNTAIGAYSQAGTTGSNNTVMGYYVASTTLSSGSYNILIGNDSTTDTYAAATSDAIGIGYGVKPGSYDVGIGYQALNATGGNGQENVAIGYQALKANTTGTLNVAIGYETLNLSTTGSQNIAIGGYTLSADTTGSQNIGMGYQSLQDNTTGGGNTAIGQAGALYNNTSGGYNTAVGIASLVNNTTSSYNTTVGASSLQNVTGGNNTALGYNAGNTITSGASNLALGYQVGDGTLTTGSSNILIGGSGAVTTPAAATSNFLNIGNTIFATSTNTGTVAAPAGSVGIGTTSPSAKLDVTSADNGTEDISQIYALNQSQGIGEYYNGIHEIGSNGNNMLHIDSQGTGYLLLQTNGGTGNVGIGSSSPAYNLDVTGTGRFTGAITVASCTGCTGTVTLGTSASVTSPQRSGDATTGLFSPATGTVATAISGTEMTRVTSTGLGIGTTSPSTALQVVGTVTATAAILNSPSTSTYPVTANGAALGTALNNTTNLLSLYNSNSNANYLNFEQIRTTAGTSWTTATTRIQNVTDVTNQGYIDFNPVNGNDALAFGNAGTEYVRIANGGNVGINTTAPAALLDVQTSTGYHFGAFNSTAGAASIGAFNTGFSAWEPLSINPGGQVWFIGGNVGIGTTGPQNPFVVYNSTYSSGLGISPGCDNANKVCITGNNGGSRYIVIDDTNKAIQLWTNNTQQVTLTSSGYVGIGTTAPGYSLDVAGNLNVRSGQAYYYNGTVIASGQTSLYNYFFGSAGNLTMTGNYNTGLGDQSLMLNTTGSDNVAVSGLQSNTTGNWNTAVGANALTRNTSGYGNTAMGVIALANNTTGGSNVAIGPYALNQNTTGGANVAVGYYSQWTEGGYGSPGSNNTSVGYYSLQANSTGNNNTVLGYEVAMSTLFSGSNNILIGTSSAVDTPAAATSNFLDIGNTVFATNTNTGTVASPAGAVGILNTGPSYPLDVAGDIRTSTCLHYNSGTIGTCSSDQMLKKNIKPYIGGLAEVVGLNPVTYQYNGLGGNPDDGMVNVGLIAQQVQKVAPELVGTIDVKLHPTDAAKTTIKTVDYGKLTYLLINAVKEMHARLLALEDRVKALEDKWLTIAGLTKTVDQLKIDNATLKAANDNLAHQVDADHKALEELQKAVEGLRKHAQ